MVSGGVVEAAVGFGASPVAARELLAIELGDREACFPGIGRCHVATAAWQASRGGLLIVGRVAAEFTPEERNLLLGMARGVGLTFRMIEALEVEHERRMLLEALLDIQRAISRREPLRDVLALVTGGASRLLGGREVELVLDHQAQPRSGTVCAPVHVNGVHAGALVVPGGPADRELLAAFAGHASVALTDARLVEAIEQAHRDAVTGLPNRLLFLERLGSELAAGARIAVLFLDLDRFKAVNDTLGHAAGDELLRRVAGRIAACVRAVDLVARFGGDEFAVLLDDAAAAEAVAERIIAAVQRVVALEGGDVFVGATVGVAYADGAPDAETLLRNADIAMYRAKNAGGGRVATFTDRPAR